MAALINLHHRPVNTYENSNSVEDADDLTYRLEYIGFCVAILVGALLLAWISVGFHHPIQRCIFYFSEDIQNLSFLFIWYLGNMRGGRGEEAAEPLQRSRPGGF